MLMPASIALVRSALPRLGASMTSTDRSMLPNCSAICSDDEPAPTATSTLALIAAVATGWPLLVNDAIMSPSTSRT